MVKWEDFSVNNVRITEMQYIKYGSLTLTDDIEKCLFWLKDESE